MWTNVCKSCELAAAVLWSRCGCPLAAVLYSHPLIKDLVLRKWARMWECRCTLNAKHVRGLSKTSVVTCASSSSQVYSARSRALSHQAFGIDKYFSFAALQSDKRDSSLLRKAGGLIPSASFSISLFPLLVGVICSISQTRSGRACETQFRKLLLLTEQFTLAHGRPDKHLHKCRVRGRSAQPGAE